MSDQPMMGDMSGGITSDDKLWSLLAYIFSPIVPVILMLMEDKKSRPFIRSHNAQALALGLINWVAAFVLSWAIIGCCISVVVGIYQIYCGIQAYQGKTVTVPVLTDFIKNQGWA
ncbi:MAG: DUF4870 domain-containing protein [Anaerolineales bacterium]|nr:DUF4870 domain-containing protein [Anaerolineales bacterium]